VQQANPSPIEQVLHFGGMVRAQAVHHQNGIRLQ